MDRRRNGPTGLSRKVIMGVASVALAVGAFAFSAGTANAATPGNGNSDTAESRVLMCGPKMCY